MGSRHSSLIRPKIRFGRAMYFSKTYIALRMLLGTGAKRFCFLCSCVGIAFLSSTASASSNYPFVFKGFVNLSDSYMFSILDATSNRSVWLEPSQDLNGFSIVAFDPNEHALTFKWNENLGILYLGGGSAGAHELSRQEVSSTTRIVFGANSSSVHQRSKSTDALANQKSSPSFRSQAESFASGVRRASPSADSQSDRRGNSTEAYGSASSPAGGTGVTPQHKLSSVVLRNQIVRNRINSRPHASDHIRDVEAKSAQ